MADRTAASLFADVFAYLAEKPDERARQFARALFTRTGDYDFNTYQMGCDEELVALGLATKCACGAVDYDGDDEHECVAPAPGARGGGGTA